MFQGFHKLIPDSTHFVADSAKLLCFWRGFEQQSVLAIYPRNPKKQRRSKENSIVADSATNRIFACCGIRLQFTKCTIWSRNGYFIYKILREEKSRNCYFIALDLILTKLIQAFFWLLSASKTCLCSVF